MIIASMFGIVGLILLGIVIVAVLVVGIVFGIRYIKANNRQTGALTNSSAMREQRLREIAAQCSDSDIRHSIDQLADRVRFSDWSVVLPQDSALDESIALLTQEVSGGSQSQILGTIKRIDEGMQQRQAVIKTERRGSF